MEDPETSLVRFLTRIFNTFSLNFEHYTDYLETHSKVDGGKTAVPLAVLWNALVEGLGPIWPPRLSIAGVALGDVWSCTALKTNASSEADDLVPFHKLTQWLTYSLVEVFQKVLKWDITGLEDLTGLPEYRNGEQDDLYKVAQPLLIGYGI